MTTYYRQRITMSGEPKSEPEILERREMDKALKAHWNDPYKHLDKGEPLMVNGYKYWSDTRGEKKE